MARTLSAFAGLVLVTSTVAQSHAELRAVATRLLDDRRAPTALHDLRAAGEAGARALLDEFAAAEGHARARFARGLAELGVTTRGCLRQPVAHVPT